jgi:hypothetical protein
LDANLRGIVQLRLAVTSGGRRILTHGIAQHAIELAGRYPGSRLLEEHLAVIDERLHVFAGLASDERDRGVTHRAE